VIALVTVWDVALAGAGFVGAFGLLLIVAASVLGGQH
jgi:hypothetical protein